MAKQEETKQALRPEQVVIVSCVNEALLARIKEVTEEECGVLVLSDGKAVEDYLASQQQDGGINETERMTAFLKDDRNRKVAHAHATEIYRILSDGAKPEDAKDHAFEVKALVKRTTLSWKKAQEMLNTLEAFAFIRYVDDMRKFFIIQFDGKMQVESAEEDVISDIVALNYDIDRLKGVIDKAELDEKEREVILHEIKEQIQSIVL